MGHLGFPILSSQRMQNINLCPVTTSRRLLGMTGNFNFLSAVLNIEGNRRIHHLKC